MIITHRSSLLSVVDRVIMRTAAGWYLISLFISGNTGHEGKIMAGVDTVNRQ